MLPKKPSNAFHIFIKEKKGQKIPNGRKTKSYWRPYFDDLPKDKKKKYEEKAKIEKEKYDKKMEQFKRTVFDIPKRPLSSFSLFIKDTIVKMKEKEEYKNLPNSELIKKASILWEKLEINLKQKFEENSKDDIKRFKYEMKQFKKYVYYIKNINNESNKYTKDLRKEDNEKDEKIITEKKINKKRNLITNKPKRGHKRTKSQKKYKK